MKVEVKGMKFDKKLKLEYGQDGNRMWWESWKGKEGVVIQGWRDRGYWSVFFIKGKEVRTLDEVFNTAEEAINHLQQLGFEVRR